MALVMVFALGYSTNVVPVETAMKASKNFLSERIGAQTADVVSLKHVYTEYAADGTPVYYRFQVGEKGFMIVSATDLATPVLAFSLESNYEPVPAAEYMCNSYAQDLTFLKNNPTSAMQTSKLWNKYASDNFQLASTKGAAKQVPYVEPLVTTKWTQEKYYNAYCPVSSQQNYDWDCRTPVGCVALTMSNLMYYYRYPAKGKSGVMYVPVERDDEGEIIFTYPTQSVNFAHQTYDYDAMCNRLDNYNGEVANLIYNAGVSVRMNYGHDGSGSQSEYAIEALQSKFGFSEKAKFQNIIDIVTDIEEHPNSNLISRWIDAAKEELDNRRPIFFSGTSQSAGGHAWIVDGYTTLYDTVITDGEPVVTSQTYFHVNWGWAGSDNGYYLLTNQNTSSSGNFNYNHSESMMLGMAPEDSLIAKPTTGDVRVTAAKGTISDGAGNQLYQPNTNRSWVIACPNATAYKLQFSKLKTKAGDKVIIYNGGTTSSPVLAEYSGNYLMAACSDYTNISGCVRGDFQGQSLPAAVNVNKDSVLVVFTSNSDDETDYGFVLDFEATNINGTGCVSNTVISSMSDNVLTDKAYNAQGDNTPYTPSRTCGWKIQIPSVPGYTFEFPKFDLKSGDFVDVFDASTNNYRFVARFDINNMPNGPFSVLASKLYVKFVADNWLEGSGFEFTFSTLTGIDDIEDANITVYPNPATSLLNVAIQADEAQDFNATIVDMAGKTVYVDQFVFNGGEQTYSVPVSSLAKGIYFLNLQSQNGKIIRKFIVE